MDFKEHLRKYLSTDEIDSLISSFVSSPISGCYLNTSKLSKDKFLSMYRDVKPHPYVENGFIFDKNDVQLGKSFLFNQGIIYISEPSAMLVSKYLPLDDDDIILDCCAAPGGKTIGTSLRLKNSYIVSNDISYERSKILSSNVERCGLGNVIVTSQDAKEILLNNKDIFTKIILDSPCSGSGMFRKENKMIDDWSYQKVLKYAKESGDLLQISYNCLKNGGVISFSTCSYSYEENEEIILNFLKNNQGARILKIPLEKGYYSHPSLPGSIHLFPSLFSGEGQFICLIKKGGDLSLLPLVEAKSKSILPIEIAHFGLDKNYITIKKETYSYFPYETKLNLKSILRYGVNLGSEENNHFLPSFHLSHFLPSSISIPLSEEEKDKYLKGEEIKKETSLTGFQVVSYQDINMGFVKISSSRFKNHYPKGLRH